ncbi:ribose-phosphate pyrophosphokinase [Mariprofundus ferrinatatus]|uniref:Ribose-phosphate pyrophosphokinase n=1 Tax=Mariprofundus ferrinatatus TaxID=1921087 RepID=A0A2K8L216_9PROT|nr:ribose-phosphate pyrophosphokinase [Mariprofundus ferrinatatus]ATX81370.1 ribose-phosphate pyrophosphokinase [Mariprofundus ferrinatatus]
MVHEKLRLFSGTSNPPLAQDICEHIGKPLGEIYMQRFSDGEIFLQVQETIRGLDAFFIQSTSKPCNSNLMELLIFIDAAKRASARNICAVIPYFGYARQDRKSAGRTPISAKLVADLISRAGATRILTLDLHATQIQGFFDIPVDNIFAIPLFAKDIEARNDMENTIIVSPDVGGVVRARALANRLHVDMAIVDKRRPAPNVAKVMNIIGEVKGKHCILIDDMVDTAGTLCGAVDALLEKGATKVSAYASHGVLSGPASERLANSGLHELVVTDSIKQPKKIMKTGKVRIITIAQLMGEAITRIYDARSISSLYG